LTVKLEHKFVDSIPEEIEEGILYISLRFRVIIHLCCCGCKNKVVTPLSPVRWRMTFDGKTISLYPSIGNWNFKCESHYWIEKSEVLWSEKWSKRQISEGKIEERNRREGYYRIVNTSEAENSQQRSEIKSPKIKVANWLKNLFIKK